MVHFSGKARKMNHIPPLFASEASNRLSSYDFSFKIRSPQRKTPKAIFERSEKEPV
ncbi:MAG: hypothetical protein U5L45_06130 [Saprospiraceae bacterium]|nr:hypothetical protein [Saprospiraceae bacterium]